MARRTPARAGNRRLDPLRWACAVALTVVAFAAGSLSSFIITRFVSVDRRAGVGQRCIQRTFGSLRWPLARLGVLSVDTRGLDALRMAPPLILVPNHPSIFDAPIVVSCFPNVCCIMKRPLLDNVFTGVGARLAGYVDNGSLSAMIRRAIAALRSGSHLLVFPEATRSSRIPVGDFTRAYALVARKSGVPMQTLLIETDSPCGTRGWSLWRRPPELPIRVRVRPGRQFRAGVDIDQVVGEMQAYFEGELSARADR